MGIYSDALDVWAQQLEAAGVPCTTDSRGQYSSPNGYVLLIPNGELVPAIAGLCRAWHMSGSLYVVADGPFGTAQARALDAMAGRLLAVLGSHVTRMSFPNLLQLASVGIDQPAAELEYAGVPVAFPPPDN